MPQLASKNARAKIPRSHTVTQTVAVAHHLYKAKLQHIHVLCSGDIGRQGERRAEGFGAEQRTGAWVWPSESCGGLRVGTWPRLMLLQSFHFAAKKMHMPNLPDLPANRSLRSSVPAKLGHGRVRTSASRSPPPPAGETEAHETWRQCHGTKMH